MDTDDVSYLLSLPIELRELALLKLDIKDILNFCAVSKEINRFCKDDYFWKRVFFRDFPYISENIFLKKLGNRLIWISLVNYSKELDLELERM